jgi:putative ABC transport system permease protein
MGIIWRKVWRDLVHNKARTILTVLSVAVGVFALGVIYGAYDVITDCLEDTHWATIPIHITLWAWPPFDHAAEDVVSRVPGVADVEKQVDSYFAWKLGGETNWRDGNLIGRSDYEAQHMGLIDLVDGDWPAKQTLAVERQSARHFGIALGMRVVVVVDGREKQLPVTGIVHDYASTPPQSGGNAAFYATPETIAWLNGAGFNRLDIRMISHSVESAGELSEHIQDRLERMGLSVEGNWIREPEEHWFQEVVDTMLVILTVLGVLSLGTSGFLIINTMNAIITQQVWQIGVVKVIGATFGRVVRIYLLIALIYSGLAMLLAIPLGAIGAHLLARWILDNHANIISGPFEVKALALGIQLAVGLIVPPLAGLVPVVGGARISPHRAISTYGLGGGFGRGWFDRLLGRVRHLPRPMALSLRNTFRRKARVSLTLIALALGGVMFMAVMSVARSFTDMIGRMIDEYGDDVRIGFERPYRVDRLIEVTENVPGVIGVEVWGAYGTRLKLPNSEDRYMGLRGMPPNSKFFNARIVSGRGLLPEDDHAILLNHKIAVDEGIQVGDEVRFDIREQETVWTVVGLVLLVNQYDSFVPAETLAQEMGIGNRGVRVHVATQEHDLAYQQQMVEKLRDGFDAVRVEVAWSWSTAEMREQEWEGFKTVFYLLLAMAVLAALVGGIGMMGTMSINVVERRREIGVMRANGAGSTAIAGIFVSEGVLLGMLSWLIAVPLSLPGARFLNGVIGRELMNVPLDFTYSVEGTLLWLGTVIVISTLASLWPALGATRVSVREALAYE